MTREDLKTMQAWSLQRKIQVTQTRIIEWYQHYNGMVYVSFSGGKDSTVLLDLVRRAYPDVPAVFVDTGLEYPEIREFVKTKENVVWLHPQKYNPKTKQYERYSFKQVLDDYGYPIISKDVSKKIKENRSKPDGYTKDMFNGVGKHENDLYNLSKWKYLIDAPFKISSNCCNIMKKNTVHTYEKESKLKPIIGAMAVESKQRKNVWLQQGCNAFDNKYPVSNPMSFWTERDVLTYLRDFKIPYASVYGDIVENKQGKLETTGLDRTGCMFCMYGVHLEQEPNRFQRMKVTHPKQYDYCIRSVEKNGLGLGKVLDFIGVKY